jgi:hypothetical protein
LAGHPRARIFGKYVCIFVLRKRFRRRTPALPGPQQEVKEK